MSRANRVGFRSLFTNQVTARKVAFIRSLAQDVEEQANAWWQLVYKKMVLCQTFSSWAAKQLKRKEKEAQQAAEKARKEELRKRREATKPRSQKELNVSVSKAQKERNYLSKSKGRGFKLVSEEEKRQKALLKKKEELAEKARILREKKKAEELEARREADKKRVAEHKAKLLRQKQERDAWNERELERQQRLIERYCSQEPVPTTPTRAKPVRISRSRQKFIANIEKRNQDLESEIENLEKQLDELQ